MDRQDYFKARLEQTLEHTRHTSKLVYLVNGATLAFFYFVAGRDFSHKGLALGGILVVLGFVNVIHGLIIRVQKKWFRNIDSVLQQSFDPPALIPKPEGWPKIGAYDLFTLLHLVLGALLIVIGVSILFA